jgi:hypothetical protein
MSFREPPANISLDLAAYLFDEILLTSHLLDANSGNLIVDS